MYNYGVFVDDAVDGIHEELSGCDDEHGSSKYNISSCQVFF